VPTVSTLVPSAESLPCAKAIAINTDELINQQIGSGLQLCEIFKSTTSDCAFYVQYSIDGGATWMGMDWSGGINGCVQNFYLAMELLQTIYIPRGLCGCWTCAQALEATAEGTIIGQIVGTGLDVCEIIKGDEKCPYYVQYR